MKESEFRPDVEGLRALALGLVLVFHAGLPLRGGFVGVDVFFVLSGFLITGLLLREAERSGTVSLRDFYARRAKRLLPAATLVLLVSCAGVYFFALKADRRMFGLDIVMAALYAANWRFAGRAVDYLAEDAARSPVLHFWSLGVEEQFYFVWPLLILAGLALSRRLKWPLRRTLAVLLALLTLPSFGWAIHLGGRSDAFFVTTTRLWELGVGAFLALIGTRVRSLARFGTGLAALGLGSIALGAALLGDVKAWPSFWALIPTLGTAFVLVGAGANPGGVAARALSLRPLQWLGGISYSAYLWHWPLLVIGQDWLGLKGVGWGVTLTLASLVPAYVAQRWFENPIRFSRSLAQSPPLALSVGSTLSLLGACAGLLVVVDGPKGGKSKSYVNLSVQGGALHVVPSDVGALALQTRGMAAAVVMDRYTKILPDPARAAGDVPTAYARKCQPGEGQKGITWCEYGDKKSSTRVVLAGDSLVLQYADALDAIGKLRKWRVQTATKSSCAFSLAPGLPADCLEFNQRVLSSLKAEPPAAVITNQHAKLSVKDKVELWTLLVEHGIQVIVIGANPFPPRGESVYQCLARNRGSASRCAFPKAEGLSRSPFAVQRQAAAQVPSVHFVDLTDVICPGEVCSPVIGDVLVFRQGSHITNSYVKTLAPTLLDRLPIELGTGH